MGDDLKTVADGPIMLDVNTFLSVPVANVKNLLGTAGELSALVNFKLHPKETRTRAVEDRLGFVVIVMDWFVLSLLPGVALVAEGMVVVIFRVIDFVEWDHSAAAGTGSVVAVIAVLAQGAAGVPVVVLCPDAFEAVITDPGLPLQTGRTEMLSGELRQVRRLADDTAQVTELFAHDWIPPDCIPAGVICWFRMIISN
jgi:hypothetical protein